MPGEQPTAAIYIAPFWSRLPLYSRRLDPGSQFASVEALRSGAWPFDYGDDPGFFAARATGGPVTWGVCRRDVRRVVRPGDVVLFFSIQEKRRHGPFVYRFCGLLTVAQKIKQTDIWEMPEFRHFRRYDNLLIFPNKNRYGWRHFEPGVPERDWHGDWISRMTFRDRTLADFKRAQKSGRLSGSQAKRFIDSNYVIFSIEPSESFVCAEPKAVATCERNGNLEVWDSGVFARQLKLFTVAQTRGSLRTLNNQRAHRHSVWRGDAGEMQKWRCEFMGWLKKNCVGLPRVGESRELLKPRTGVTRGVCS